MKSTRPIIALLAVSIFAAVSCGNRNTGKTTDESAKASVETQKQVLADSILAIFDTYAREYDDIPQSEMVIDFKLTEKEKLVKPTYLLDPDIARTLVTKQQKINTLAILIVETAVRKAYDMPTDKSEEAIVKLSAELNHPVDPEDAVNFDIPSSEKARILYQSCRERGELGYFWRFNFALITAVEYVIANDPDTFFKNVSEEDLKVFAERDKALSAGIRQLARYDAEMRMLEEFIRSNLVAHNLSVDNRMFKNREMAEATFVEYKAYFCDIRNNMIF